MPIKGAAARCYFGKQTVAIYPPSKTERGSYSLSPVYAFRLITNQLFLFKNVFYRRLLAYGLLCLSRSLRLGKKPCFIGAGYFAGELGRSSQGRK
ncbi:hypothetical protein [Serratia ureilytica]|uniref:hypothetical protein n=1 Tax=Serratia ureilytica TaxID=300181 RepID=UPI00313D8DF3